MFRDAALSPPARLECRSSWNFWVRELVGFPQEWGVGLVLQVAALVAEHVRSISRSPAASERPAPASALPEALIPTRSGRRTALRRRGKNWVPPCD
jgi:hypothetical protein